MSGRWPRRLVLFVLVIVLLPLLASCGAPAPDSKAQRFVLSEPAEDLLLGKALYNRTIHQSFAFDNTHKQIYFTQVTAGGLQLPGEKSPVDSADRAAHGDLTLTKLDSSGNILGYMYLKGFGHGVGFGVEPAGDDAYMWTETDSNASYGTQLARFKFEHEKVLTASSPELEKHQLIEGSDRTTLNIDSAHNILTMRYRKDGVFQFSTFDLEEVKKKQYKPIATVRQPTMGTVQGFASYGNTLYLLEGDSYENKASKPPVGNTYIAAVDWGSGKTADKQLITAGADLSFREPEGLGIRVPDIKQPYKAELVVGFASGETGARMANLFALRKLLPVHNESDKGD
ncbi:Tat pathway signal sequence domain protein [Paenibacillus thalictri]|uniref:Tat pathway signal sequence domain protein n=1 Tax=Paenibacillus thalictri TaxID=2527873 RepID=A0A4Q9DSV7_9BACL|nr:Tat pathway signal sequence domain protein [Paenibacillus thalictri]TBL79984.1 Tat pathway signal sequence domain protein [Paenibacillus thalictri]